MKLIVLYSTRSGNTKKIADEIASELNCESLMINQTNSMPIIDLNNYDLINKPNRGLLLALEKSIQKVMGFMLL